FLAYLAFLKESTAGNFLPPSIVYKEMARRPRFATIGGIYHAYSRGNNRQAIFLEARDYAFFCGLLSRAAERFTLRIFAFCLMPNHFHLLAGTMKHSLSDAMGWLLTCYAMYFNRGQSRQGHLFQDRFKSPACANDRYFMELLRYIHLNPLRGGLVKQPEQWPWSGHKRYVGGKEHDFVDSGFGLSLFDEDATLAVKKYLQFLNEGLDRGYPSMPVEPKRTEAAGCVKPTRMPAAVLEPSARSLDAIAAELVLATGVSMSALRLPSLRLTRVVEVRRELIRAAISAGFRPAAIARYLNCSASVITRALI
ncbi:MAG: transposase, partial [Elusimicrobia bacterium]|nr:transposase [Elusimicrobiota bacterium]